MLIIPAIDLKNGQCVRLTQGRRADVKVYDGEPVAIAKSYADAGAEMIHVVDLDGAFDERGSMNREVAARIISAVRIPVQFGGGLRSVADARELIERGAQRIVIGTLAVESPAALKELVRLFGSHIAVGIDAKDGEVLTRGWEHGTQTSAVELARRVAEAGVERIVYTDVGRDGMLAGVNVEQTRTLARESGLKVTASGGVSSLDDLQMLKSALTDGVDSVIVGKALYEKRFTLAEALLCVA
jgi:phosphoribosylformimino-5-aminoimidazole carboxamide ribotide isomerase